ncbi:MAG TPA: hypothetical protein VL405_00295 [Sphingomonas sp.]|nr:hypothetical protein [Sphingomonas sp.]
MRFTLSHSARLLLAVGLCFSSEIVSAQSYAALATAFADAPLVARVRVIRSQEIKPPPRPDRVRYFVSANVTSLIRAPSPQPPAVDLLADLPLDSRGKRPKVNKSDWLISARPVGGKVQLLAPPVPWSTATETRVRAITAEATAAGAPGAVRRVSGAYYSPGNIPGESETQIFVDFINGTKGSLSVLRRPNAAPDWHAAFGEVASDSPPPARDTLGWFRLACGLPKVLPEAALGELDGNARTAVAADYQFVLTQLGACDA